MRTCGLCGAIHYVPQCPYAERGIIPDWCDEEHRQRLLIVYARIRYEARRAAGGGKG